MSAAKQENTTRMRCFVAIPVPAALAGALGQVPAPERVRAQTAGDLHLTLAFLGERERQATLLTLWPVLQQEVRALGAFTVTLSVATAFPGAGDRVWAALAERNEALLDIHQRVWRVLEAHGVAREVRAFRPHVTLGRAATRLAAAPWPGPWALPVREVVLYESPRGGGGYRPLAAVSLAGAGGRR